MGIQDDLKDAYNGTVDFLNTDVGDAAVAVGEWLRPERDRAKIGNDTDLAQSKYDFNYAAFPNDLGMDYLGHYMVININVPVQFNNENAPATYLQNNFNMLGEFSKVDVLRFGNSSDPGGGASRNDSFFTRRTKRIVQSIALYMPGTQLIYNSRNVYEEVSMTALAGQLATGVLANAAVAAGYLATGLAGGAVADGVGNIGGRVGSVTDGVRQVAGTALKLAGRPINPCVEVLFSMTALRDFQFEFLMTPRNEQEAATIQHIIKTLRFHAAPELITNGFQFIPPAEFDITFFHNGVETDKLPRINTCVLVQVEVDYAPGTGVFSSFRDGQPVATRLMLVFKEVEIIHKLRVLQGF